MRQTNLPQAATIRRMQQSDLAAVLQIQSESFNDATLESQQSFQAKLTASPATCFVALHNQFVVGYLVALIADSKNPPALDDDFYEVPSTPDCLYLHDLSVSQRARGLGVANTLINEFLLTLRRLQLPLACLTAVNNSSDFWARQGFHIAPLTDQIKDRIATYGCGAQYMIQMMGPPGRFL